MAYTSRELINNSWYLSNIVSRNFQTVDGDQLNDGLFLLNSLLAIKSANTKLIPYYTVHDFELAYNVEDYFIPNLLMMETFVFFIDGVRYSTAKIDRKRYFGSSRADRIQSLPFSWHFERGYGGGTLRLYFKPASNYAAQLVGKFGLTNVDLNQDLSLTYDAFYLEFFRYSLAEYMCQSRGYQFPQDKAETLKKITKQMENLSPPDMSSRKVRLINGRSTLNYGQVNIGGGWTV